MKKTKKKPAIDLSDCTRCGVCFDTSGTIFEMSDAGFIQVVERADYPEDEVNEAIKYCPEDCIYWEEE